MLLRHVDDDTDTFLDLLTTLEVASDALAALGENIDTSRSPLPLVAGVGDAAVHSTKECYRFGVDDACPRAGSQVAVKPFPRRCSVARATPKYDTGKRQAVTVDDHRTTPRRHHDG
ncbi:hypothetical protein [Halobaculum marinum]|uniref:Uncharacterized protein n=1 Tax=Halobaculum marinum TaxID=3031996 RepID=A0ABD5WTY8_9EURY|nr:hypothetical protein [Halobaculum sp. DT55]